MESNVLFDNGILIRKSTTGGTQEATRLESINVEFSRTHKEAKGGGKWPDYVAEVGRKATIKAKLSAWDESVAASLGGTKTTGVNLVATETPTMTSHTETVAHTPVDVIRVVSSLGADMVQVAETPVANTSYTRAAGVFTFHNDEPAGVVITYTYADAVNGNTITVSQAAAAAVEEFDLYVWNTFTDSDVFRQGLHFFAVYDTKAGMSSKEKDFGDYDVELGVKVRQSDQKVFEAYFG
jgi:hypothetical protein